MRVEIIKAYKTCFVLINGFYFVRKLFAQKWQKNKKLARKGFTKVLSRLNNLGGYKLQGVTSKWARYVRALICLAWGDILEIVLMTKKVERSLQNNKNSLNSPLDFLMR